MLQMTDSSCTPLHQVSSLVTWAKYSLCLLRWLSERSQAEAGSKFQTRPVFDLEFNGCMQSGSVKAARLKAAMCRIWEFFRIGRRSVVVPKQTLWQTATRDTMPVLGLSLLGYCTETWSPQHGGDKRLILKGNKNAKILSLPQIYMRYYKKYNY